MRTIEILLLQRCFANKLLRVCVASEVEVSTRDTHISLGLGSSTCLGDELDIEVKEDADKNHDGSQNTNIAYFAVHKPVSMCLSCGREFGLGRASLEDARH